MTDADIFFLTILLGAALGIGFLVLTALEDLRHIFIGWLNDTESDGKIIF